MFEDIELLFKKLNVRSHRNQGITVCNVEDAKAGVDLVKQILYTVVDRKTVLYLSGGSTPKALYAKLAKEEKLKPGAMGQIDERYGMPLHQNSNQLMMRDTGILRYFEILDIPFYPILRSKTRSETAEDYDQKIRELNAVYSKSTAIMGIGDDGHTAGLPALSSKVKVQNSKLYDNFTLVTEYNDTTGKYGERITTTFLGLEMIDLLIVLVFGSAKQNALELMFSDGSEEDVPARFYKRADIAKKTLLITDQNV